MNLGSSANFPIRYTTQTLTAYPCLPNFTATHILREPLSQDRQTMRNSKHPAEQLSSYRYALPEEFRDVVITSQAFDSPRHCFFQNAIRQDHRQIMSLARTDPIRRSLKSLLRVMSLKQTKVMRGHHHAEHEGLN